MMRKYLIALLLIITFLIPVIASALVVPVCDFADLLSEDEETALITRIENIRSKYGMQAVFVTTYGTGRKSITDFAADFYDANIYNDAQDGIIFVVDMSDREYVTVTTGTGIAYFNDEVIGHMEDSIIYDLSSGAYFKAFDKYLSFCEYYLQKSNSYDSAYRDDYTYYQYSQNPQAQNRSASRAFSQAVESIPIVLFVAAVISGITIGVTVSRMKTAKDKKNAAEYVERATLIGKNDIFLRASESRVKVVSDQPRSNSGPSHGSGGGSTTFRSSSGNVHGGGRSGHF